MKGDWAQGGSEITIGLDLKQLVVMERWRTWRGGATGSPESAKIKSILCPRNDADAKK